MDLNKLLQKHLFEQRRKIFRLAARFKSPAVSQWAQDWDPRELKPRVSLLTLLSRDDGEMFLDGELTHEFHDLMSLMSLYSASVDDLVSGNLDKSFEGAFHTEYWLGHKQGKEDQKEDALKKIATTRHQEKNDLRKVILKFYRDHKLETLSNEEAAKKIGKANLVKMSHRTIVDYVGKFKKYIHACTQSEGGKAISAMQTEAKEKLEVSKGLSAQELAEINSVLDWVSAHENERFNRFFSTDFKRIEISIPIHEKRAFNTFLKALARRKKKAAIRSPGERTGS